MLGFLTSGKGTAWWKLAFQLIQVYIHLFECWLTYIVPFQIKMKQSLWPLCLVKIGRRNCGFNQIVYSLRFDSGSIYVGDHTGCLKSFLPLQLWFRSRWGVLCSERRHTVAKKCTAAVNHLASKCTEGGHSATFCISNLSLGKRWINHPPLRRSPEMLFGET